MSKPEHAADGVWWTIGQHTRTKLHTDEDCPTLQRAGTYEETDLAKHPDPEWCQRCSGDGRAKGGGSRDLYERAKRIGEQRAEGDDES